MKKTQPHRIYLDHAATTPLTKEAFEAMKPYLYEYFGNPNSQHLFGREAAKGLDEGRAIIAECIGAKTSEIYFVASGTEADNWAIKGAALSRRAQGNHIITSKIEHPAVYNSCQQLEKYGFEVTYLDVDKDGFVSTEDFEKAITDKTILASIMFANNEIGTIQPIKELADIARKHKIIFHTDAVQATGAVKYNVEDLGVSMLSMSGHKFGGPKGIGVLYIKNGTKIEKLITGGEQERGQRGGTSNVPNIVAMATALKSAVDNIEKNNNKVKDLRDHFVEEVEKRIAEVKLNGTRDFSKRLVNNVNFSFRYIEGESILFSLDLAGIAASSGSACSAASLEPSRVLLSIGVPVGLAHGSIRFSFGNDNSMADVDYTIDTLVKIVERLRNASPLFNK